MIWRKSELTIQLANPHTLRQFLSKFPDTCRTRYITFRELTVNEGRRSDEVLNDWLKLERKKQLALDDL